MAYGNDLSAVRVHALHMHAAGATHRSLFPTSSRNDSSYCGWNLNCFARTRGSLLRYVRQTLPGITDPMVYAGMVFSYHFSSLLAETHGSHWQPTGHAYSEIGAVFVYDTDSTDGTLQFSHIAIWLN